METVEWSDWINDPQQPPPPSKVKKGELRITYINHSTVLIQIDEINILTDPVFSERAGPFPWTGTKRVRAPGVRMDDLPNIDIILISHDHYDHLDMPTIDALSKRYRPTILAGLGVKRHMKSVQQEHVVELDWWQEYVHSKDMKIIFTPSRHTSGRGLFDTDRTLWGGFVIESPSGNVLFMGDTAYGGFIEEIGNRYSHFRTAILPIGSYEKRWFMKSQHMNPDDAVRMHKILGAQKSIGIHFGTFREHPEQEIDAHETDLKNSLEKHNIHESDFWILEFGEGRYVENEVNRLSLYGL
jgi:L-ascorbate metabolism protein UlaG (beta-lactamase superfamily)